MFAQKGHANTAYTKYNDKLIDGNRRIRIEIIVDPKQAPGLAVPSLASRIAKLDNKPLPVAVQAAVSNQVAPRGGRGGRARRGARRGGAGSGPRRATKTVDELDAEMTDYMNTAPGEGVVAA